MITDWILPIIYISIITSAVVAGVFLTFSDFVMRSLNGAKTAAGIEVMQIINREVFKTVFMVLLLGMAAVTAIIGIYAYFQMTGSPQIWIIAGGAVYFAGVFVVSLVFNVPMNNRLDKMDHNSPQAAHYWQKSYFPRWTFWNYVRAISAALTAICFLVASTQLA